jgi:DNA-binding transcriptional LysR family regulator
MKDEAIVRRTTDEKTPIPYVVRTFPSKHFRKFEETIPFEVTSIGNSLEAILTAVCAGFGAGILPVHAARQFGDLERLPFPEGGLSVPFYIVFRKDAERHPAVAAFLKTFRKHCADTRASAQV